VRRSKSVVERVVLGQAMRSGAMAIGAEEASEILANARRALYRVLAEDESKD